MWKHTKIRQNYHSDHLACCYEEVTKVKSLLDQDQSTLKLSQKTSSMSLHIVKDKYFFKCKISVPNDYPTESVLIEKVESNYPRVFKGMYFEIMGTSMWKKTS